LFDGSDICKLTDLSKKKKGHKVIFYRTYDNFKQRHYCIPFPEDFHKKKQKKQEKSPADDKN
jgi:hypothetical protein